MTYKQQTLCSLSEPGSQIRVQARLGEGGLLGHGLPHKMDRGCQEALWSLFYKVLTLCMRTLLSRLALLLKTPSLNTVTYAR